MLFAGSANETQTLVLTVTNDTIIEANETLRIRISAVDPGVAQADDFNIADSATVTII